MRINLLPPEVFERQRTRRLTIGIIALGIIILLAIGAFYVLQVLKLSEVEDDIQAQETVNAGLRQEIAELQDIAALQAEISSTRALLASLLDDSVLWSGVLRDVSLVIPGEVWLDGLNGQLGSAVTGETGETTTGTATAETGGLVGQVSFTGFALTHRDVALWLSRLEDIRGFVNPWLSNASKTEIGTAEAVQYSSSVDLSEQALARRRGSP